jgi:hypothetical protein
MIEYLNCDACTAVVSTEMTVCDYCGNDFRHSGVSAEILKLRDDLDKKYFTLNVDDFLKFIEASKYREHPIVKFRKAKALLIEYMTNDGVLDAEEFCDILNIIRQLKDISQDYWFEFAIYTSVILPTGHTKLYLKDFNTIKSFLQSNNLDEDEIIRKKLKEQVMITDLGEQFFKEYYFYTDPKNFVKNEAFIHKRDYLKQKYEQSFLNINK